MTQVLIGDTYSHVNVARLKELGWGRMFAGGVNGKRPAKPFADEPWGFDNWAFKCWQDGLPFDEFKFMGRLHKACALKSRPFIAVVPDIVAGGCSSLQFSLKWIERLRAYGQNSPHPHNSEAWPSRWPWYLAVQDGMTIHDVKPFLPRFDGIFLGGSDTFKTQAWRWRVFAKDNGKPFHYARAGTLPKLESALKMHADSLDSAYPLWEKRRFARFQEMYAYWNENPRPTLGEKEMGLNVTA